MTYLFNVRNDGWQNLVSSVMVANPRFSKIPVIPEVVIYFGGKVMRGNRTRKVNEIIEDYPQLTIEDILATLAYAADREHKINFAS